MTGPLLAEHDVRFARHSAASIADYVTDSVKIGTTPGLRQSARHSSRHRCTLQIMSQMYVTDHVIR